MQDRNGCAVRTGMITCAQARVKPSASAERQAGGVSWSPLASTGTYYSLVVDSLVVAGVLTWCEKSGEWNSVCGWEGWVR